MTHAVGAQRQVPSPQTRRVIPLPNPFWWRHASRPGAARLRSTWLLVLPAASFVTGIVIVVIGPQVLPARFYYDSHQIQRMASESHPMVDFSDPSFGSVAAIYRILGLGDAPLLAGLLTYLFAAFVVFTAFRLHRFNPTIAGVIAGSLALLVAGVYLGTYSKDLFVLPIALVALHARRGWVGHALLLGTLLLYAHSFRDYWYLNVGLYLIFVLVSRPRLPRPLRFALPFIALAALALIAFWALGVNSDFARQQVNAVRQGTADARTAIYPFVDLPRPFAPIINTEVTLLTLFVPVPLIATGQPYYVVTGAAIAAIWTTFFLGAWRTQAGSIAHRCVLLMLTFVTTQALFEPDYGSALRHTAPLLGLITYCALVPGPRTPQTRKIKISISNPA